MSFKKSETKLAADKLSLLPITFYVRFETGIGYVFMNSQHYDYRKLAEARANKCTQQELAEALGIVEMTVNRAEKGKQVSYELLLRMCEYIGLDIRDILTVELAE